MGSQVWDKTYREMFTMALLSGSEQVCSFGGVDGLRQTCESVWSGGGGGGGGGGGLGPQPTAALVLQPDSRTALAARQELQDVDTEQGPS